jgi:hypothetical protein
MKFRKGNYEKLKAGASERQARRGMASPKVQVADALKPD